MARYAASTQVSSTKSRAEIESILTRYGANGFAYGWQGNKVQVCFLMNGKQVRFQLLCLMPMPVNSRIREHAERRDHRISEPPRASRAATLAGARVGYQSEARSSGSAHNRF